MLNSASLAIVFAACCAKGLGNVEGEKEVVEEDMYKRGKGLLMM